MAGSGSKAVFLALVGNGILAVVKFVAFLLSGSGAMLSEAIHSAADTGNQALLFVGARRSHRKPDAMYHYGYGAERFLFSLLAAVGIFVLGCGVTVYHGVHNLLDPPALQVRWWVFAVLGVSLLLDGAVLITALREVARTKGEQGLLAFIRTSSDPTVLAVLFEDSVATLGVVVAVAGIGLSVWTGNPVFDALSSIVIGLMLGAVAFWLGYRNRQLILGPAIPDEITDAAVAFLRSQPTVDRVRNVKTRIVGSNRFKIAAELDYNGRELSKAQLSWARERIIAATDEATADAIVADLGEALLDGLGHEVNRLEAALRERFPELAHLDLESD